MILIAAGDTPRELGVQQNGNELHIFTGCCGAYVAERWNDSSRWLCSDCGELKCTTIDRNIYELNDDDNSNLRVWLAVWTGFSYHDLEVVVQES